MKLSHALPTVAVAVALTTIGIAAGGCGGGGGESYGEVLRGLKRAAISNGSFDVVPHAKDLNVTERTSVEAFCEVLRQMMLNDETAKASETGYFVSRIEGTAEDWLGFVSTKPVAAAVGRMRSLYDLASFNLDSIRRYAHACYH